MLSVHDVNRYMENKKREKYATFETIYEKCKAMIMKFAANDKYRFFFEVPEFILGLPLYDLNDAVKFMLDKLHRNGYLVKYYFPKILYISWSFDEIHGGTQMPNIQEKKLIAPPPRLSLATSHISSTKFPPNPISTRNAQNNSIVMPDIPPMHLPLPKSTASQQQTQQANFIKSISDYKSSGKFTLNIS